MKNNNNKRSVFRPVLIVALMALVTAVWQLAGSDIENIVPIENVEIEGAFQNLSLHDVRRTVTSVLDGGYFTVDLGVIRGALLDLPWVEDAAVRRQWPSGLYIKVIEKQAIAYWGKDALLSSKGVLFSPATIDAGMPLPGLDGPDGQHEKVLGFLTGLNRRFDAMGFHVRQLVLDERRAWSMKLSAKDFASVVEVKLGRGDTTNRLARFVRVFSANETLDLANIDVIDMRYPNGFAMRIRKQATDTMFNGVGRVREV